jgi:hypothetical protein
MLTLAVPVASAGEPLSKQQIVDRSAVICRDMLEAAAPHLRRAREAAEDDELERFIRESRRAIDAVRRVEPDLKDLVPPTGALIYRHFVRHGRTALDLLDAALDALEQRRLRLARERRGSALEHLERARHAARRYGLRRSCIRLVS